MEQFLCLEQSFMASAELYGLGAWRSVWLPAKQTGASWCFSSCPVSSLARLIGLLGHTKKKVAAWLVLNPEQHREFWFWCTAAVKLDHYKQTVEEFLQEYVKERNVAGNGRWRKNEVSKHRFELLSRFSIMQCGTTVLLCNAAMTCYSPFVYSRDA